MKLKLINEAIFKVGEPGLNNSWQAKFPKITNCVHCGGESRIGFVTQETHDSSEERLVCDLHENDPDGAGFWPHDAVAVAVYFCKQCLETSSLYNQA